MRVGQCDADVENKGRQPGGPNCRVSEWAVLQGVCVRARL
jgi:hypothetical protein